MYFFSCRRDASHEELAESERVAKMLDIFGDTYSRALSPLSPLDGEYFCNDFFTLLFDCFFELSYLQDVCMVWEPIGAAGYHSFNRSDGPWFRQAASINSSVVFYSRSITPHPAPRYKSPPPPSTPHCNHDPRHGRHPFGEGLARPPDFFLLRPKPVKLLETS